LSLQEVEDRDVDASEDRNDPPELVEEEISAINLISRVVVDERQQTIILATSQCWRAIANIPTDRRADEDRPSNEATETGTNDRQRSRV